MAFAGELGIAVFGGSALAGFGMLRVMFGVAEGPIFLQLVKPMPIGLHLKKEVYYRH